VNMLSRLRWAILACVLLGFFAYGIAEEAPFALLLLLLCGGTGWWVTEGRAMRSQRLHGSGNPPATWQGLPRWVTNIALAFVVLMAVLRGTKGESVISAFAAFLAAICVLKLWEKREPTDYGQLLTMSVFLSIGATLNSNALGVGVVITLLVPCLVFAAFLYQMFMAQSKAQETNSAHLPGDQLARMIAPLASATRRALVWWVVIVVVLGFALATLVFIVTPRGLGGGQLGDIGRLSPLRQTGFTDEVNLTDGGLISQSQAIIMTARFSDGRTTVGSAEEAQYLRGAVLNSYESGRWTTGPISPANMVVRSVENGKVARLAADVFETNFVVTIEPRSASVRAEPVFHPIRATRVRFDGDSQLRYEPSTGAMLRARDRGLWSYDVFWSPRSEPETTAPSRRGLVTFADPFVREEAARILRISEVSPDPDVRPSDQDALAARIFEAYLRSQFQYTLDTPSAPSGADPVVWFLRTKPDAHCEFFASALAALCRSVGIDARVIAGYMTTEFDDIDRRYIIRSSNAHAWVEVNTAPGAWRVFDGTPIASPVFQAQRRTSLLSWFSDSLSNLDMLWNSAVVSFDDSSQRRVLGVPGEGSQVPWSIEMLQRLPVDRLSRVRRVASNLGNNLGLFAGIGLVLVGGGAIIWSLLQGRTIRTKATSGWAFQSSTSMGRLHARTLALLQKLGVAKPASVPLARHLHDLASSHADPNVRSAAQSLGPIAESLYAAQFGARVPGPATLAAADATLRALSRRRQSGRPAPVG